MAITISGSGIVEANLADNAVTLAKMASGTAVATLLLLDQEQTDKY